MDHGRLKALFNTDEQDDEVAQAFQARMDRKPVDESKVVAFTQATARKSKKEKEEEAAEAKRRQHELETTQVFEEYVADFAAAPRAKGGMTFVRAGEKTQVQTTKVFDDDSGAKSRSPPPSLKPKGKRAMDMFLEEIKKDQAAREQRFGRHSHAQGVSVTSLAALDAQGGSRDRGDPETTNLFVAHLPENVTEDKFGEHFGQFGPITSIKIMWPRGDPRENNTDRRSKSGGLSGFVSFKRRRDAEIALKELDGMAWAGSTLRVGWSKAVPTSGRVLYGDRDSRSRSPSPRRHHHRHRSRSSSPDYERHRHRDRSRSRHRHRRDEHGYRRSRSRSASRSRSRERYHRGEKKSSHSTHKVSKDEEQFIELVAMMTRAHGKAFEDQLMIREKDNTNYDFLFKNDSSCGRLYVDLLDPEYYSSEGFEDDGYDEVYSTDNEEAKEAERAPRNRLCPLARKRFHAMLRAMVGKRGEVARCMAFCLEHGEAAVDVANIVISSLLVDSTPVPKKIARLHLISDIVHNSAVGLPSAWKYRQEFQSRLGLVFDHLSTIYHSFGGRMTAETFKRQVVAVIDVWDDRIVFPPDQTSVWKERLDGKAVHREEQTQMVQVQEKRDTAQPSKFKSAFKPIADIDGEEDMDLDEEDMVEDQNVDHDEQKPMGLTDEDIDGAPMDDDIDGEVLDDDIDGKALDDDDIDGAPIDDLDGAPLEGDVDGDPVDLDGDPF
ncbi:hypothetical protein CPB86DRAFT_729426 [Serendipita vermifera]|nr:hypothetical protein CPB86DRAFT_729426 [Serendipita vermifera]